MDDQLRRIFRKEYIKSDNDIVNLCMIKNKISIPDINSKSKLVKLQYYSIADIDDKDIQRQMVKFYGDNIKYIDDPDKDVQLAAVNQNGYAIKFIKNPDKDVQLAAVKKDGYNIKHIKNPDKDVQLAAVNQDGCVIQYIDNPDKDAQLASVKQYGYMVKYIDNPDKDVQLAAVNQNGGAIQHIKNPDKKIKLEVLKLEHIKHSKEKQLEAVKQNGWLILNIKNPDKELQYAAIKQNHHILHEFKAHEDVLIDNIEFHPSIAKIVNPTVTNQFKMIKKNIWSIQYIKNPDKDVQLEAIKTNIYTTLLIKNIDKKLKKRYLNGTGLEYLESIDMYIIKYGVLGMVYIDDKKIIDDNFPEYIDFVDNYMKGVYVIWSDEIVQFGDIPINCSFLNNIIREFKVIIAPIDKLKKIFV